MKYNIKAESVSYAFNGGIFSVSGFKPEETPNGKYSKKEAEDLCSSMSEAEKERLSSFNEAYDADYEYPFT